MMIREEIDTLLASRGYPGSQAPIPIVGVPGSGWEPVRDDAIATMLCQGTFSLNPDGLHWLLDHYCELKSPTLVMNKEQAPEERVRGDV